MKHPFDDYKISDEEKKRIDEFISLSLNQSSSSPELQQWAFCFLAARKFSVAQALELYQNNQAMLQREAIPECIDPFDEEVRQELLSGKFVVLNDHDTSGARVAQFFVRLHRSMGNQRALLQSILFQLDTTLKREAAARSGLVFIYDMTDAKFSRVDRSFGMKLFKLLQSAYPVRLRRILILTAPLWFRASFRVMRGLIRDQLRDCVSVVKPAPGTKLDALSHPDMANLRRDHYAWLYNALIRSGWLLSESEQAIRPNGHRLQTAAAFFGSPSANSLSNNSSGSLSDLSDPESRDDEESSCSGNPTEEEDETISFGDMDPFGLSSSYSSEVENGEIAPISTRSPELQKSYTVNRIETTNSLDSASGRLSNNPTRIEHSETPTPPSIAKRSILVFPHNTDPTQSSAMDANAVIINRPHTIKSPSSIDQDMGFSENLTSALPLEPETPTAESTGSLTTDFTRTGVVNSTTSVSNKNSEYRNSAGAESCSSSISFFSTGSAAISSVTQSADCSPTVEQQPRIVIIRPGLPNQRISIDKSPSYTDQCASDDLSIKAIRIAPLAEDEIGDQTIRHRETGDEGKIVSLLTPVPSENNLPSWAVGRPHGYTIHQWSSSSESYDQTVGRGPSPLLGNTANSLPFVDDTSSIIEQTTPLQAKDAEVMKGDVLIVDDSQDDTKASDVDDENTHDEEMINFEEDAYISEDSNDDPVICLENYWMTPKELVDHVISTGLYGIHEEYNSVSRIRTEDPRNAFKHIQNREKNRYFDVICYENSRVFLRPLLLQLSRTTEVMNTAQKFAGKTATSLYRTLSAPATSRESVRNYIHANWVDGYRQKNAFICTQGPLAETTSDFWQMIWDYHVPIIVMITKVFESDRVKCFPYWPDAVDEKLYFACGHPGTIPQTSPDKPSSNSVDPSIPAEFEVINITRIPHEHFTCSTLGLKHLKTNQTRYIKHYAYSSWPDHGVPQNTQGLQQLLSSVQAEYGSAISELGYQTYVEQEVPPPPVVVHCSAGIGRTGTYVTADICTKWLTDPDITDHRINIPLTVSRVRSQRCGCVQVAAQYVFCYRVVLDHAIKAAILDAEYAQPALSVLSPSINSRSPVQSFLAASFYPDSSASLPRHNPFALFASRDHAPIDIHQFLPTSQLLSIWQAVTANKDRSNPNALADENFVMMENPCSQSDLESSSTSSENDGDMIFDHSEDVLTADLDEEEIAAPDNNDEQSQFQTKALE